MKMNEKNLAAFATSGNQIDRDGYLMKKGDGNKNFAKRWFILKGNLLFYFEKKSDREPLGVIILEGSTIELAESEMEEHFCFKIVFPSRSYTLSAESHQLMEQWMKSLACATYDYVKLMAAELQRQLDELTKPRKPTFDKSDAIVNFQSQNQPSSRDQYSSSNQQHVPTPPPRSRSSKNVRTNERKTFDHMHREFGAKILRDQEFRWAALSHDNQQKKSAPTQLSILKQTSLIDL